MKKILLYVVPIFISITLYAYPEEPTPSVNRAVIWHTITVIDYKPGTVDAAKSFIEKFESASEKSETPSPVIYWFESGKYDLVITWEFAEEPASLEGGWSPAGNARWWEALVAQEGSEEAARQLQDNYSELIASTVTNVARKAN